MSPEQVRMQILQLVATQMQYQTPEDLIELCVRLFAWVEREDTGEQP